MLLPLIIQLNKFSNYKEQLKALLNCYRVVDKIPNHNRFHNLYHNLCKTILILCHRLLRTKTPAHPQGGRGSRGGFRDRGGRGRGRGRGGLILCYWCRDFLPKEQANHKMANCPYQNQARDAWWKRQLGNGATLPTRSIPSPVENLSGNTQQNDQENC